ncbi:MAG: VWA domain-containing protein [Acidobacteriota bacterium]|nr:VWA domain-containing protein [Acidobacteriota bacterium]
MKSPGGRARLRIALVAALLSIGVLGTRTAGQDPKPAPDPQQPVPVFRAGTAVVRVDVTATARDEAVTDLTAADFEVTEDDVPQEVQTSQFIRVDGERKSDLNDPLEIRSKEHAALEAARDDVRLFAIFLDDYHIDKKPDITLPLREALTKYVNQFRSNDLLVLMDPLTTLYDLKYTRSKTDLANRIHTFEGRRGEVFPVKSAIEEAQMSQRNWQELRAGVTLSALTALATQLGGMREGRKSILFVSQGPPVRPGSPNDDRLKEAMQAANRGNVTIHVLDPRPLGTVAFGGDDVLRRIAYDTGGRAIVNTNNPAEQLQNIITDASAYYLIGYTPARTSNDGKYHRIEVKVKRRGVNVTARRGYWAASEKEITAAAEAAATPVNVGLTTALAALSQSASNTRAVGIWTGLSRATGTDTRIAFTWEASTPATADKPARLEIQPVDDAGKPALEAQVIAGAPGEVPMVAQFDLAPGRYRIRFTSLTVAGDIIDRWIQSVTIPSLSNEPIALSTPRFLRARNMIELRAIEANPAPAPTAATRFRPGDRVLVEIECWTAPGTTPEIKVELLNAKGDVLKPLPAPALVDGRFRMTLPVGSLAPSTYVLKVTATVGEQSAEQWAAFRLAP